MPTTRPPEKIVVENVIRPGKTYRVEARCYGVRADRAAAARDGFSRRRRFKTVQLDLEAKGVVARTDTTPLRVHKKGRVA